MEALGEDGLAQVYQFLKLCSEYISRCPISLKVLECQASKLVDSDTCPRPATQGGLRSFSFHVTLPPPPAPPPYFLHGVSERWLGCTAVAELDFSQLALPRLQRPHRRAPL